MSGKTVYSTARDVDAAGQVVGSSPYAFYDDGSYTHHHPNYPSRGPIGTWYYQLSTVVWENKIGTC